MLVMPGGRARDPRRRAALLVVGGTGTTAMTSGLFERRWLAAGLLRPRPQPEVVRPSTRARAAPFGPAGAPVRNARRSGGRHHASGHRVAAGRPASCMPPVTRIQVTVTGALSLAKRPVTGSPRGRAPLGPAAETRGPRVYVGVVDAGITKRAPRRSGAGAARGRPRQSPTARMPSGPAARRWPRARRDRPSRCCHRSSSWPSRHPPKMRPRGDADGREGPGRPATRGNQCPAASTRSVGCLHRAPRR
jgi:hypothetical protein